MQIKYFHNFQAARAYERRGSADTIISSSFDISDIETRIDTNNMYDDERSDSIDISGTRKFLDFGSKSKDTCINGRLCQIARQVFCIDFLKIARVQLILPYEF